MYKIVSIYAVYKNYDWATETRSFTLRTLLTTVDLAKIWIYFSFNNITWETG